MKGQRLNNKKHCKEEFVHTYRYTKNITTHFNLGHQEQYPHNHQGMNKVDTTSCAYKQEKE